MSTDQNTVARVSVANLADVDRKVTVVFRDASAAPVQKEKIEVASGQENAVSNSCGFSSCPARIEVKSRSPLIAPTLRYVATDGVLHEVLPGDFVVTRDGKRVW